MLIAVFNMAFADVLLTAYAVPVSIVNLGTAYSHQWLITGVAGELRCRLSQFIGQMSVLVSTAWKFACDCLRSFFFLLVFYPLERLITLRIARFLNDCVHNAVIQNDHFGQIQAGLPCLYLQFWNHWLNIYLLFCFSEVLLLPIITI